MSRQEPGFKVCAHVTLGLRSDTDILFEQYLTCCHRMAKANKVRRYFVKVSENTASIVSTVKCDGSSVK